MKNIFGAYEKYKNILIIGGLICFIFLFIGGISIILNKLTLPFSFDLNLFSNAAELEDMQEINPRIQAVQKYIDGEYKDEGLEIDGILMASTIQTLTLYDSSLEISSLDEEYDENIFTLGENSEFPSYTYLKEMAEGMIATKVTITCEEIISATKRKEAQDEGIDIIPKTYTTSYIEELVDAKIDPPKTCKNGYKKIGNDRVEHYIYDEVYKKIFLPKLFSEHFNLNEDDEKDAEKISTYIDNTFNFYQEYRTLIYDESTFLEGIVFYDSDPLITNGGQALPINMGVKYYGATLHSPFGYREHPYYRDWRMHTGIDLGCEGKNPPIYAIYDGIVISAREEGERGLRVVIKHDLDDDGVYETLTSYQHLYKIDEYSKTIGAFVSAGNEIGLCGITGVASNGDIISTGTHLHFEIIDNLITTKAECDKKSGHFRGSECYLNPEPTLKLIGEEVFSENIINDGGR